MDALIPAFVVAALAETGSATQLLAAMLAARFGRPVPVLLGIAMAAALNMAIAAAAGVAMARVAPHPAMLLLIGVALLLAGGGAFVRAKRPSGVDRWRLGALPSSAGAFLIHGFGDGTQFAAAAIAGASPHPALVAAGAAAGIVVADVPAVLLGAAWPGAVPVRALRHAAGVLLLLAGAVMAIRALGIG